MEPAISEMASSRENTSVNPRQREERLNMDILLLRKMNGAGEHKSTHPSELDRLPLYSKLGVDPPSITRRLCK